GGESEFELSLDVPSDLGYVGPAVELIADRFRQGVLSPRRVRFNLRTALAEALANAIAYGNRLDARRLVHVRGVAARYALDLHVPSPRPLHPTYRARRSARQRYRIRQSPRCPSPGARARRGRP